MKFKKSDYKELFSVLSEIENEKQWEKVSADLFTPNELETFVERWKVAKELLGTEKSQREIQKDIPCALATVSRANKQLKNKNGGFILMWKALKEKILKNS